MIRVEIDYYNSVLVFIKNPDALDDSEDESYEYEMPIKLDAGPLYAFTSIQHAEGRVSILN